jgi:hypothetical protein
MQARRDRANKARAPVSIAGAAQLNYCFKIKNVAQYLKYAPHLKYKERQG